MMKMKKVAHDCKDEVIILKTKFLGWFVEFKLLEYKLSSHLSFPVNNYINLWIVNNAHILKNNINDLKNSDILENYL